MTSLARLRSRVLPTARQLSVSSIQFACLADSHATYQPFARSLQTSADTTLLTQALPEGGSTPFSVKLHEDSFRAYNTDTPSLDVEVTKDSLLKHYTTMVTMRRMEQAADALYKSKLVRGFCHLAIGQVRYFTGASPLTYHSRTDFIM